jgi:hypothetical protein
MNSAPIHRPQVNNVAEQEYVFGRVLFQKFQQVMGLASLGSEVYVRQEDRADLLHGQVVAD